MTATHGFVRHGVRWNEVTGRYDVSPTEATEARATVTASARTGQGAGRGDQQVRQGAAAAVTETAVTASGTDVGPPPPLRHPVSLAAPISDHANTILPTPESWAAGPMGAHAARGGRPMEAVTWSTGGTHSGNTGGSGDRNGSSDSGGLGGAVGAVGSLGTRNSRGGRGGGRRGGGGGGWGRSRRGSGGRPRVPCSRDGCTSTFAQRAGTLGGGQDRLPYIVLVFFFFFTQPDGLLQGGRWQVGAARGWKG